MYSFIKIFSVQYAKTCHVYIIYDRTSVIIIDYTETFKMHRYTLGSFHAGSAFLLIKLCNNVSILNSISRFCFCIDGFWNFVGNLIFQAQLKGNVRICYCF